MLGPSKANQTGILFGGGIQIILSKLVNLAEMMQMWQTPK